MGYPDLPHVDVRIFALYRVRYVSLVIKTS